MTIPRNELRQFFDRIPSGRIFAVRRRVRNDVYLRYPPQSDNDRGKLAYVGDHSLLETKTFCGGKRGSKKILLAPAGSIRWVLCRKKTKDPVTGQHTPTKHWRAKEDGELNYNPEEKGLYGPVYRMYNDSDQKQPNGEVRMSRWGQHATWGMIALEGVVEVKDGGKQFVVVD